MSTRDPKEKTPKKAHRGRHEESWGCVHLQAVGQRTEDSLPRYILGAPTEQKAWEPSRSISVRRGTRTTRDKDRGVHRDSRGQKRTPTSS